MKKTLILSLACLGLISNLASAQTFSKQAKIAYVHFDTQLPGMQTVPTEDTIAITGDVAEVLFTKMTNPVLERTYSNICILPSGKILNVEVVQRNGLTFGCEMWPEECWGKVTYKCESKLDLATGFAKERQTNGGSK